VEQHPRNNTLKMAYQRRDKTPKTAYQRRDIVSKAKKRGMMFQKRR